MVSPGAEDFNYGNLAVSTLVGDASASLMCAPPWQLFRTPAANVAGAVGAGDTVKIQLGLR